MVLSQIATLREIEEHWTLDDLMDAIEVLNVQTEVEKKAMDKSKKK